MRKEANFYYSSSQNRVQQFDNVTSEVYLDQKWIIYTEMQDVETSEGSDWEDEVLLGTTDYWYIRINGVVQSKALSNYLEVKDKFDREMGITITTNPRPCKNPAVFSHMYGSSQDIPVNVGTIGHVDHGNTSLTYAIQHYVDRLQKPCQDFSSYLRSLEYHSECLGDFDKKVVGKHCYPHWHKQKY